MPQEIAPLDLTDLQSSCANHGVQDTEPVLPAAITQPEVRQSQAIVVILQLTAITFLTSMSTGLMTVSIPRIAADLAIQPQLYYW